MDTVKIHNSGKKYEVYFYAIMYQIFLTYLDYLRAVIAAYSIVTAIMPLLTHLVDAFVSFRAYTPGSSHLLGQLRDGEICFQMVIIVFHPSTGERLLAEDR